MCRVKAFLIIYDDTGDSTKTPLRCTPSSSKGYEKVHENFDLNLFQIRKRWEFFKVQKEIPKIKYST